MHINQYQKYVNTQIVICMHISSYSRWLTLPTYKQSKICMHIITKGTFKLLSFQLDAPPALFQTLDLRDYVLVATDLPHQLPNMSYWLFIPFSMTDFIHCEIGAPKDFMGCFKTGCSLAGPQALSVDLKNTSKIITFWLFFFNNNCDCDNHTPDNKIKRFMYNEVQHTTK